MKELARKNILNLTPYSSARDEFKGEASVFLDANENSEGSPYPIHYNRYPDPRQKKVKLLLSKIKQVNPEQIFLGNGSDEAIDLLFRIFCEPGKDNVIVLPPTYGMYAVQAQIHGTEIRQVPLNSDFQPIPAEILEAADEHTKLLFLCSPNNPSGNLLDNDLIEELLLKFKGIVVIDEAYIDFADADSWSQSIESYPNLVVLQTLSKAWGLAGLRVGMAIAPAETIQYFNKVKYPYNIGNATLSIVEEVLGDVTAFNQILKELKTNKKILEKEMNTMEIFKKVYPSDANFFLAKVDNAQETYDYLAKNGVIVRNRTKEVHCENCLRITVGTAEENHKLVEVLNAFSMHERKI
jgi:histidinol-phosphate aminotransferase